MKKIAQEKDLVWKWVCKNSEWKFLHLDQKEPSYEENEKLQVKIRSPV